MKIKNKNLHRKIYMISAFTWSFFVIYSYFSANYAYYIEKITVFVEFLFQLKN